MMRAKQGLWAATLRFGLAIGSGLMLAACNDTGMHTSAGSISGGVTTAGGTQALSLGGSAATTAVVGTNYSFTPTVTASGSATLAFTVQNKPAWASFDTATGALTGTPAASDVGAYGPITISVTDGSASTTLTSFSITVATTAAAAPAGTSALLSWAPPTENTDGTPLVDLAGYTVRYANATGDGAVQNVSVPASSTSVEISALTPGTYWFIIRATNSSGAESDFSTTAWQTIG
jgi:hypothetical protein